MAIQFNELPVGRTADAANALQNLRDGFMVDRFTGARVSRVVADQRASVNAVFNTGTAAGGTSDQPVLVLDSQRTITATGSYHITDRNIIFTGSTANFIANSNGVHISFYNCDITFEDYDSTNENVSFAFGITTSAGNGGANNRGASAAVDLGAGSSRSVNFYGCTVTVGGTRGTNSTNPALAIGQIRCQIADSIGSDFRFIGRGFLNATGNPNQLVRIFPSPQRGGRWINSTFTTGRQYTHPESRLFTYGFPEEFEGIELYGLGLDAGLEATASGPRMLLEPNFSFLGQQNIFTTQGTPGTAAVGSFNANAQILQSVGFYSPPDLVNNADDDVIGDRANSTAYINFQNGGGGALNYVAYQPTYLDAVTLSGLQGVKVRVNTSVTLSTTAATSATNFHTKLNSDGTAQTIPTNFDGIGNEYLTDTTGQLVSSMRTNDGWSTSVAGYYDPMVFDFRTDTTTNPGRLAQNDLTTVPLTPPEHTALAIIQDARGILDNNAGTLTSSEYTTHEAQYQAFSWSHDVLQDLTESSTSALDGATVVTRLPRTSYGINRTIGQTVPSVIGTFVKPGFTNSDNTPDQTALEALFTATSTPSINDIRMAYRYERYQYRFTGNPQTTNLAINVDSTHPNAWMVTGNTILIRGAGLSDAADDLFTADANIATIDMNGHPISGLTLGTRDIGDGSPTEWSDLEHSVTEPAATNCTLAGEYDIPSAAGPTVNINFNNCNLSQFTIGIPAGLTVNIYGTDNTGPISRDSFFSITGSGTANFPTAPSNYVFSTGSLAGRVAIRNLTTNTNIVLPTETVTAGTPFTMEIPSNDSRFNDGDVVRLYYKAATTATNGYAVNFADVTIQENISSDVPVSVAALAIPEVLFSTTAYTGASINVTSITGGIQIDISGATSTTRTGAQTQNLLLPANDDVDAFSFVVNNELQNDLVRAGFESTAVGTLIGAVNDGTSVTLNSGETGVVQLVQAVDGNPTILGTVVDGTVRAGIPSVTIFDNPAGLSVDGATLACRNAIQSENVATTSEVYAASQL